MVYIEFFDAEDGSVGYNLVTGEDEHFNNSFLVANKMAKRGLTKKDTERYKLDGYFGIKVYENNG